MKKLSLKNVTRVILTLCLITFLASSCSTDDKDAVEISKLETNKTNAYIDEKIILNIEGSGYENIDLTSNTTALNFNKLSPTSYEITTTAATTAYVYVKLSNNVNTVSKSIKLTFFNHGVSNYIDLISSSVGLVSILVAEGIKTADLPSKVLQLLGEPAKKTDALGTKTSTSNTGATTTVPVTFEKWHYFSKGITVTFLKSSGIVYSIEMVNSNSYASQDNGEKIFYTAYTGNLSNGWKINDPNTKMDAIITKLGVPIKKESSSDPASKLRTYTFSNFTRFSFFGDTEDDYAGKVIQAMGYSNYYNSTN